MGERQGACKYLPSILLADYDPQITYSVTVAEEQSRIENGGTAEDGSTTASAVTLRGMEGEKNELEAKTVPMHSMFRRTSSDSTSGKRSTSMHDEALKTSRHRNGLSGFKVEDAVIEVLSSDEEIQPGKSGTKAKSDDYIDHSPKQEDETRSPPVEEDVLSPSLPADGHA